MLVAGGLRCRARGRSIYLSIALLITSFLNSRIIVAPKAAEQRPWLLCSRVGYSFRESGVTADVWFTTHDSGLHFKKITYLTNFEQEVDKTMSSTVVSISKTYQPTTHDSTTL